MASKYCKEFWNSLSVKKKERFNKMTSEKKDAYYADAMKRLKQRESRTAIPGEFVDFTPDSPSSANSSSSSSSTKKSEDDDDKPTPRVEDEVNYEYEFTAKSCKATTSSTGKVKSVEEVAKLLKVAYDKKATKLRVKLLALSLKLDAVRLKYGLTTTELSAEDEKNRLAIKSLTDELYKQVSNLSVSQAKNTSDVFIFKFKSSFSALKNILADDESKLGNFEDYPDLEEPLGKLYFVSTKYQDYLDGRIILAKKSKSNGNNDEEDEE